MAEHTEDGRIVTILITIKGTLSILIKLIYKINSKSHMSTAINSRNQSLVAGTKRISVKME